MFEGFPTFYVLVRPLLHVKPLVLIGTGPGGESFPTQVKLIGPIMVISFAFDVLIQVRAGHVSFLIMLALKRPLSSVYSLVKAAASVFETHPTFLALIGSFSNLNIPVPNEGREHKGFPTIVAFVRPFSIVNPLVQSKYIFVVEGFPTFTATERFLFLCAPFGTSSFYRDN